MVNATSNDTIRIEVLGEGRAVWCMGWQWIAYREQHAKLLKACKQLLSCSLPNDVSGRAMIDEAVAVVAEAEGGK